MSPQTFIFMGRSGSGKGTQVSLLMEYLKANDAGREILHLETGREFRKLLERNTYSTNLIKNIYDAGGLMPDFLPIWVWSDFFLKNIKGDEHMVIDGVSRRLPQAEILDSALKFYKREKPIIVYVNVSREWAFDRLIARKRIDDNADDINNRLDWFDREVRKALAFYKDNPDYHFLDINGEQSIAEVHKEIVERLKSLL